MSDDTRFSDQLETFIEDLTTFATGSYLKDDEQEFWEAPYPVGAVTELGILLRNWASAAQGLSLTDYNAAIVVLRDKLDEINDAYEGALIEQEEAAELDDLIVAHARSEGHDELDVVLPFSGLDAEDEDER